MKPCLKCSNMLTNDATYCHVCNTKQTEGFEAFETMAKPNDTFLKVLCILTIIGAGLGLISLPISLKAIPDLDIDYPVELIVLGGLLSAVKLTAAILMLRKKLIGLYIYTGAAVVEIGLSVYTNLTTTLTAGPTEILAYIGMAIGLLFSVTFIILYWLPVNRRLLS